MGLLSCRGRVVRSSDCAARPASLLIARGGASLPVFSLFGARGSRPFGVFVSCFAVPTVVSRGILETDTVGKNS